MTQSGAGSAAREDNFETLADQAPVMLWRINSSFDIAWANKTWFAMTGGTLESEENFAWVDKIHPDDRERVVEEFDLAFSERRSTKIEFRILAKDSTYRWLVDEGEPVFRDGQFDGFVGSCVDVTECREAELRAEQMRREILRLSRDGAAGSLSAVVVHELSQPLQAIVSFANALQVAADDASSSTAAIKPIIDALRAEADRAHQIAGNCRTLVAGSRSERRLADLADVLSAIEPLIRSGSPAGAAAIIDWDLTPELVVEISSVQIGQVLTNLVTNALEASEGRPRLKISAGAWGRYAIVTVTDWGRGIAPRLRKSVLEEPASNKQGGMGIGLLLSRAIVLDHGGRIWFGDNPEGGTVFKFTVPLAI